MHLYSHCFNGCEMYWSTVKVSDSGKCQTSGTDGLQGGGWTALKTTRALETLARVHNSSPVWGSSCCSAAVQPLAELKMMHAKAPLAPAEVELARQWPSWSSSSAWARKMIRHTGAHGGRKRKRETDAARLQRFMFWVTSEHVLYRKGERNSDIPINIWKSESLEQEHSPENGLLNSSRQRSPLQAFIMSVRVW